MKSFIAYLARQAVFSRATFGPGPRTKGVLDHITKEQAEVLACYPADRAPGEMDHFAASREWADIVILGLDGLLRSLWAAYPNCNSEQIAAKAVGLIRHKQGVNEVRDWPDWRGADPDKAIEHDRSEEEAAASRLAEFETPAPPAMTSSAPVESIVAATKARIAEITGVNTDLLGNPEPTVTTRIRGDK